MRFALALLLAASVEPALATEQRTCPSTSAQLAIDDIVNQKIGGYVEGRNVALGKMIDNSTRVINGAVASGGLPAAPPISQADVDAKRLALANLEVWAMSLEDLDLRKQYLCSIMSRRRGVDDADREMIDHHVQKEIEQGQKKSPLGAPVPSLVRVPASPQ